MKNIYRLLLITAFFAVVSCQTRIHTSPNSLTDNSLELYKKYNIQTKDHKMIKVEVLKIDDQNIYGKNKQGETVAVPKNEVEEVRAVKLWPVIIAGAAAIAAVILIPI